MSNRQIVIIEKPMDRETEKAYSWCLMNKFHVFPKSVCRIEGQYFKKGSDNGLPLKHSVIVLSIWKPFFDDKVTDSFKNDNNVKIIPLTVDRTS